VSIKKVLAASLVPVPHPLQGIAEKTGRVATKGSHLGLKALTADVDDDALTIEPITVVLQGHGRGVDRRGQQLTTTAIYSLLRV